MVECLSAPRFFVPAVRDECTDTPTRFCCYNTPWARAWGDTGTCEACPVLRAFQLCYSFTAKVAYKQQELTRDCCNPPRGAAQLHSCTFCAIVLSVGLSIPHNCVQTPSQIFDFRFSNPEPELFQIQIYFRLRSTI